MGKRLGTGYLILVASPDPVRRVRAPRRPAELSGHRCIRFLGGDGADPDPRWRLRSHDGRSVRVRPSFRVSADSFGRVIDLARIGEGIALVPESTVRALLHRRELLRLLPDWATADAPAHLVYSGPRQALPKVRAMLPVLEKHFGRWFAAARG